MLNATQIRAGYILKLDNVIYRVLKVSHLTPGKGNAQVQADLRNLKTGIKTNIRLRPMDTVDKVDTEERAMSFLYRDGTVYHFMDPTTFEQTELHEEQLEDMLPYLKPEAHILMLECEGKPISIRLPDKMSLTVVSCEPPSKGSAGNLKDATVETNAVFKVPMFIKPGDTIVINTETGDYIEKG
jgi:elongation factor P